MSKKPETKKLKRALSYRRSGEAGAGFSIGEIDEESREMRQVHKPGLLDGIAGIGLSLLAASTGLAPDWDRSMLISIPPKAK